MADPRVPDPRDPAHRGDPHVERDSAYTDPAADPRVANQTIVQPSSGRGGLIAAGVIAVLLVIALIAFSTGPATDPGTTAVIPDQTTTEEAPPAAAPAEPATPAPDASAPADGAPAAPTDQAPAADQ